MDDNTLITIGGLIARVDADQKREAELAALKQSIAKLGETQAQAQAARAQVEPGSQDQLRHIFEREGWLPAGRKG